MDPCLTFRTRQMILSFGRELIKETRGYREINFSFKCVMFDATVPNSIKASVNSIGTCSNGFLREKTLRHRYLPREWRQSSIWSQR